MNFSKKKTKLSKEIFENLLSYVDKLIATSNHKSLQLTDEEFKINNNRLYKLIKNHFEYKGNTYLTIRISFSDNKINNQFHYDAHGDSTVIPIKFENFKKNENNGELFLSKKSRNYNNSIMNLFIKLLVQNRLYRHIIISNPNFFFSKFNKIEMDVGDEVSFNGFKVFHGNRKLDGSNKIRASLIVHSQEIYKDNKIYKFIKFLRHKRNIVFNKKHIL
ncbi:hypothetical protein N8Z53_00040 [Candidatus Pelagibacter ubique]|nr:hypothetical protein [Candidatus Pelagibacter ubique]